MPTDFDDFSARAGVSAHATPAATANRAHLRAVMTAEGFTGIPTEWWHFDAPGWHEAKVLDVPLVDPQ
jgi:D-alanyl-D-alanine dipeptidase